MGLNLKSAAATLLLGATLLTSCSTWTPGTGYSKYKSLLKNEINEVLTTAGADSHELLIHSCNYIWVVSKGNVEPTDEQKAAFDSIIYKVKYTLTYSVSNVETKVDDIDYFVYQNKQISFITTEGESEFAKRQDWVEKGTVYGAVGVFDYRKL
jgi:hypothetical protein